MEFFLAAIVLLLTSVISAEQEKLYPVYMEPPIPKIHRGLSSMGARITNGETATEGQIPYQVGLKIKHRAGNETMFCGGTLISRCDVLTAAHCCDGANKIEVILGSIEIYNETNPNRMTLTVLRKNVKIHEEYDKANLINDICIIRLPKEVELSDHIRVAELPTDDSTDYLEASVIASGWGRDSDQADTISSVLKFVRTRVIRNVICNIFYLGRIKDTNICTNGAGGMSTCNGDSGGPLVLETSERNSTTLVGITSFGISFGCETGWPPAFTRVSKYLEWIKENMK